MKCSDFYNLLILKFAHMSPLCLDIWCRRCRARQHEYFPSPWIHSQSSLHFRCHEQLLRRQLIQLFRQRTAVWHASCGFAKVIKERMSACLDSFAAEVRDVREQVPYKVHSFWGDGGLEDAAPGVGSNLRKLELLVVRIHALKLFLSGCAEYLDDLDQLVHTRATGEYR